MSGVLNEHHLYRFYDRDDVLLYIGVTGNLPLRLQAHRSMTPWFSEVAQVATEAFPNRRAAFAAEVLAIRAEQPRRNVRHTDRFVEPRRRAASP